MRFGGTALVGVLVAALLSGCVPDKQQGAEDKSVRNPAKFDTYGINVNNDNIGMDKGPAAMLRRKQLENREPHLVAQVEQHAERIPGVRDIKVIAFKDNLLVGVLTDGMPRPATVDPTPSIPHDAGDPVRIDNGHTDLVQLQVIGQIRRRLQAETSYNILYVSTNRVMYERIANVHARILRGEKISDDELQTLVNDIGYTVKGIDLVG